MKNDDDVPQLFNAVLLMPGQSFRLPFSTASTYSFACTAHASGQMTVVVAPGPAAGWERLAWRLHHVIPDRADKGMSSRTLRTKACHPGRCDSSNGPGSN
jgi:hypothetical protein